MRSRGNVVGITVFAAACAAALHAFADPPPPPIGGVDVKVTLDNHNVDAGPGSGTPAFDGRNLVQNETTLAISPVDPSIVAVGCHGLNLWSDDDPSIWLMVNVSTDGGATFHNTYLPGFRTDTSAAGLASPLKGLRAASDPVLRFDASGNLFVVGLGLSGLFTPDEPGGIDSKAFIVKYDYTPGSPGGASTPHSAGNPPSFTYAFTTIVATGSSASRVGTIGKFEDQSWFAIDTNPDSPGLGNIYFTLTRETGVGFGNGGVAPLVFCRSTDGGHTFSEPIVLSVRDKQNGIWFGKSLGIGTGSDGRVYVGYFLFDDKTGLGVQRVIRSDDLGRHFGAPVTSATYAPPPRFEPGCAFRSGSLISLVVDDTDSDVVYTAYPARAGSPVNSDVFVVRSTDGGITWGAPVRVNDDGTAKPQVMPTLAMSHGTLHVSWCDLRDSPNPSDPALTNDVMNVYYTCSNVTGYAYPAFAPNRRVSDVGFQPNYRLTQVFQGTQAFIGDYNEMDARWDGANHIVHLSWADTRDIPPAKGDLDSAPGPFGDDYTGRNNLSVYADRLVVAP